MIPELTRVLSAYGLSRDVRITPFGTGLINHTWKVDDHPHEFILQRINTGVFTEPGNIAHNIELVGEHLQLHHPGYLFVRPVRTVRGENMYHGEEGYFRMSPFIKGSHTVAVVDSAALAYEAAGAFGKFARLVADIDPSGIRVTIPSFHDLTLRCAQFDEALKSGRPERLEEAAEDIAYIRQQSGIAEKFEHIKADPSFRIRVTHHDTKISNVLFDANGKGLCVIDPDTIMPGYFISDVGDMMRTYLPPVSEEEQDLRKISIRNDVFEAIVRGYGEQMNDKLTPKEKEHYLYAGKFMIYMQAIRFLTDFLNNDVYYGTKYPGHNLVRARNQLRLLQELIEKENALMTV